LRQQYDCPHVLLLFDKTYRTAVGVSLMKASNARWSEISEAGGDDFDEREPFDDMLDQVHGLAYDFNEYYVDDGPGSFCECSFYFSESESSATAVVQRFSVNH
jgi:hypothetical protein